MSISRLMVAVAATSALAVGVAACGSGGTDTGGGDSKLSGSIAIDGSSTVFPFAQAAAEEFQKANPNVKITVGESGTGGGFEKFCRGEIQIADASRPIKDDEEAPICKKNGVAYSDVQVANDGIAIATNKGVTIDCLTTAQLKQLWNKGSKVTNFNQIDPKFPDQKVSLFGPGTDSGTFDFFTEQINGEKGATRTDYQPSEDDNVLVQGVSGDKGGLGYFGFSYYEQNQDKLNLVAVDSGKGCVAPSKKTIQDGTYTPLSRPLYIYPNTDDLSKQAQVKAFVQDYVDNAVTYADTAQLVPLTPAQLSASKAKLSKQLG